MRILVSNDDGISSPRIAALARAAQAFGDVRIVAPNVQQSSAGHGAGADRGGSLKHLGRGRRGTAPSASIRARPS